MYTLVHIVHYQGVKRCHVVTSQLSSLGSCVHSMRRKTASLTVHTVKLLHFSQEELESYGLDDEQVKNLKRTFDQFDSHKAGALSVGTIQTILKMMGMHISGHALQVKSYLFYKVA